MFWKLPPAAQAAYAAGPTYRPETTLLVKTPAGNPGTSQASRPQRQPGHRKQAGKSGSHPQLELALE